MDALSIHRVGHWMYKHHIPILPKLLQLLIYIIFNSYVPYQLVVGGRTRLGHRGIGVVLNKDAIIGSDVLIRAHVTIGKRSPDGEAPIIGNNVEIGDGAKVIGGVYVGDGVVIGANAVVLKDVPENALAVGVPAQIKVI